MLCKLNRILQLKQRCSDPRISADWQAAVFSIKVFVSAMLAFYVAIRNGLQSPTWTLTTAYLVAQPFAAAVRSKAVFRLIGTCLGAVAMMVLVPNLANSPAILTTALALWLGLCIYLATLDRTPRSYAFLLAGYTASAIGFLAVDTPQAIFDIASSRVQEVCLGIVSAAFVHSLALPASLASNLLPKIDSLIKRSLAMAGNALGSGGSVASIGRDLQRFAGDIILLHHFAAHIPYERPPHAPHAGVVRAIEAQLLHLAPTVATIEDRIVELERLGAIDVRCKAILKDVAKSLTELGSDPLQAGQVDTILRRVEELEPRENAGLWPDLLKMNLASRVRDLLMLSSRLSELRHCLVTGNNTALGIDAAVLVKNSSPRRLHVDHGLAIRAATGAFATTVCGAAFWIATGWPDGGSAVSMAGVLFALFAAAENPTKSTMRMLFGSAVGVAIAAIYTFAILPRVGAYETLIAVLAPVMLGIGTLQGRESTNLLGLGVIVGFFPALSLGNVLVLAPAHFINAALAQLIGMVFAVLTLRLSQTIGKEYGIARIVRASWRDVARRARGDATHEHEWISRMVDRVGLLVPKLTTAKQRWAMVDILRDLRVGYAAGRLHELAREATGPLRVAHESMLSRVANFFGRQALHQIGDVPKDIAYEIDGCMALWEASDDPRRREALILLVGLKRNLFPFSLALDRRRGAAATDR